MLAEIVADLDQPHDPGTIRPTRLEDWVDSRLMRISFRTRPSLDRMARAQVAVIRERAPTAGSGPP